MGCMFVATNVGVTCYAVVDNKIKRVKSEFLHAAHKHQSLSSPTTSKPCWTLFCGGSNLLSSLLTRLPVPLSPCPLHNSTCYLAKSSLSFKVSRSLQTSSPLCNSPCGQNWSCHHVLKMWKPSALASQLLRPLSPSIYWDGPGTNVWSSTFSRRTWAVADVQQMSAQRVGCLWAASLTPLPLTCSCLLPARTSLQP